MRKKIADEDVYFKYFDQRIYLNTEIDKLPHPEIARDILDGWGWLAPFDEEAFDGEGGPTGWGIKYDAKACVTEKPGLCLIGPSGSGKTRIAVAVVQKLASLRDVNCISAVRWASATSDAAKNCKLEQWLEETLSTPGEWSEWNNDYVHYKPQALLIDDLDKARFSDTVQCEIFNVVETAMAREIPMIITMNSTGKQLQKKFVDEIGAPLIRRISEACTVVNFAKAKPNAQGKAQPTKNVKTIST